MTPLKTILILINNKREIHWKNCTYLEKVREGSIFITSHFDGLEKQPDMVYDRNVLDPSGQTLLFALFAIYHAFFKL